MFEQIGRIERVRKSIHLYEKHPGYFSAGFVVAGFLFDLVTTDRIDQNFQLLQQFAFLVLAGVFLTLQYLGDPTWVESRPRLKKVFSFKGEVFHFFIGGLLSVYTIFYFKAASSLTGILFLGFIVGLLVLNEVPIIQQAGPFIKQALFGLCTLSFFIYVVPIFTGSIGPFNFLFAIAVALVFFSLLARLLRERGADPSLVRTHFVYPSLAVTGIFAALYFWRLIPPVPLALKHIGVYHAVTREVDRYVLSYDRPWWKVWQNGAQDFVAQPGDRIYLFTRIFAPSAFRDELQVQWLKQDKTGNWNAWDTVPLRIAGGRDQGFRGFVFKSNFEDGDWQVRVLTSDLREVGRIHFTVTKLAEAFPREFKIERQ